MDNEYTWWYLFDANTYAYIGMLLTDSKPENSTDVAPGDVTNPVWDPTLKTWNGEEVNNKLDELNKDSEGDNVPVNVQIQKLSDDVAAIKQDVESLKNK